MWFVFELLLVIPIIVLSIAITILISQPFQGALVRLRANYLPKAVSLDNVLEDGAASGRQRFAEFIQSSEAKATAKIGPVVPGIIAMLRRTKRLEGWAGLYKGMVPVVMQLFWLSLVTFFFFESAPSGVGGSYKSAPAGPGNFSFFTNLVFMFVVALAALPLTVVTHRAIVHPRILPWNAPVANLQELLSYSELRQPWRLYLVPGLAAGTLLHLSWIGLATRLTRQILVPSLGGLPAPQPILPGQDTWSGNNSDSPTYSTVGLVLFFVWNLVSLPVLAPLECALVRLSTQRPEKQNPLHLAYANAGPSSYSHQASVAGQTAAPAADLGTPSRASFAIEDPEEEEEGQEGAERPLNGSQQPPQQQQPQASPPYVGGPGPLGEPVEPVIALRPCDEPESAEEAARMEQSGQAGGGFGAPVVARYTGLFDCLRKMREEEGLESWGRGWWVTLVGMLGASFS